MSDAGAATAAAAARQPSEAERHEAEEERVRSTILNLGLDDLNITAEEIDFSEVDGDLLKFQEDDIVREALSREVDLRTYSRSIAEELREAEEAVVEDYVRESGSLATLHGQIKCCDQILETMQTQLGRFQEDLGSISSQIKTLQDKSVSMSVQLRNRKLAEEKLSAYIQAAIVSPELVRQICEAPVNEQYVRHLETLDGKVHFLKTSAHQGARATQDVAPTIEKLRLKAVARIREFLLERIYALRKPKTNVQIKQNLLLRYASFYRFLLNHGGDSEVAAEVRQNYVDTMAKRYHAHFRTYLANLRKLQRDSAVDKNDLLGTDESKTGGFFSTKKSTQHMNRVFALSQRAKVLDHVGDEPIIFHVAQQASQSFPYEFTFRSAQHLLMDTATSEYAFISEFFGRSHAAGAGGAAAPGKAATTRELREREKERRERERRERDDAYARSRNANSPGNQMFTHIFARTMSLFLEHLEDYLFGCYDCIGLLVMLRIIYRHNKIMQSRRVYCLDAFFDRVNMLLWPRFKMVLDLNMASLDGVKRALRRGTTDPHYVTVRYANLCTAVLTLNRGYDDEILTSSLARLRARVESLLLEMAGYVEVPKAQVVFLINNYETVLCTLRAHELECDEAARFEELAGEQTALYVEEELQEKFGKLVGFVKQTEQAVARAEAQGGGASAVRVEEAAVRGIARHFAQYWRQGLEQVNASVQKTFATVDASGSMEILKQTLIQLVLYYQRFQDLIGKLFAQPAVFGNDLVPIPTIMYEIKKYSARG